jgi:hypothetical protein
MSFSTPPARPRFVAARVSDADTHAGEAVTHWGRFFVGGVKVEL